MFACCNMITHLPDDFTIPDGVTNCSAMFCDCIRLTRLPDGFIIPQNVTKCVNMLCDCEDEEYES